MCIHFRQGMLPKTKGGYTKLAFPSLCILGIDKKKKITFIYIFFSNLKAFTPAENICTVLYIRKQKCCQKLILKLFIFDNNL